MMNKVFVVVAAILGTLLFSFGAIFVATLFVWMGWNWGLVPVLAPGLVKTVTLEGAFFLSMCFAALGSSFGASSSTKVS